MMLVKIAKGACFRFKKLSDFRLEIYKLYASRTGASKPIVEKQWKVWNSTAKMGFEAGIFHTLHRVFNMWKIDGLLRNVYHTFVENFLPRQNRQVAADGL